jgi:hypothetical protein
MPQQSAYEVELVTTSNPDDYLLALLATLTGLPLEEARERLRCVLPPKKKWGGQTFVRAARELGYATTLRFVPFVASTPWPGILRCAIPPEWGTGWWALVYASGHVLNPLANDGWHTLPLDEFKRRYPRVRITSMLPVWMEFITSISH